MRPPLQTYDASIGRFDAAARTVAAVLLLSLAAGLLALGLSINDRPAGLALLGVAITTGTVPYIRWRLGTKSPHMLPTSGMPVMESGYFQHLVDLSNSIQEEASVCAPGPIQEHVQILSIAARNAVIETHGMWLATTNNKVQRQNRPPQLDECSDELDKLLSQAQSLRSQQTSNRYHSLASLNQQTSALCSTLKAEEN